MNTSVQQRKPFRPNSPGPWLARVVNHLDLTYMGGLEVAIIKGTPSSSEIVSEPIPVRYMTPFYGVTQYENQRTNPKEFDDVQKSYGMWFVPPDPGTLVMVIFVGGDYSQGYWIGCVPEKFKNRMVPGIGAEKLPASEISQEIRNTYGEGVDTFPVAESLTVRSTAPGTAPNKIENYPPIHPFALQLSKEGLLKDAIRGVTSSSARREIPSMVFGISTPGPIDKNGPKKSIQYQGVTSEPRPYSRLGGSTFVMDDGDADGNNELVRIRTRTGHQILLHNTKKLIYIANGEGTSWLEMTERGKIDIYAQDSVSIHSVGDFNFRADRDVNIEAGGNINLHAFQDFIFDSKRHMNIKAKEDILLESTTGEIHSTSKLDTVLSSQKGMFVNGNSLVQTYSADGPARIFAGKIDIFGSTEVNTKAPKVTTNNSTPGESATQWNSKFVKGVIVRSAPISDLASLPSFLGRVPMHEPWPQHETSSPQGFPLYQTQVSTSTSFGGSINQPDNSQEAAAELKTSLSEVLADLEGSLNAAKAAKAIIFTTRSGTEARFRNTDRRLQGALIAAASFYKKNYGKPIIISSTIREKQEQQLLYDVWKNGGGSLINPTVYVPGFGNISTPVNPAKQWPNEHFKGKAADINPDAAEVLYGLGIWNQLGIKWGGLFTPPDRVHVSLTEIKGE
jgi:hypothetical protein